MSISSVIELHNIDYDNPTYRRELKDNPLIQLFLDILSLIGTALNIVFEILVSKLPPGIIEIRED